MKELLSRNFAFTISLAFLVSFAVAACSETPTGEEGQEEEAMELYEPLLGKWKSLKIEKYIEFKRLTDTKGSGRTYSLDETDFCDNGHKYFSETSFEWTMVDTTLPIKTIRKDLKYRYICGDDDNSITGSYKDGYEIKGDTLILSPIAKYILVEEY